jgi:murein DD-endopeptidase MepM/ murein hydrolase activator NlpD
MTFKRALFLFALFYCSSVPSCLAKIELSNKIPKQGEIFEVYVSDSPQLENSSKPTVMFLGRDFPLFPYQSQEGLEELRTLIAVPADLKPGHYKIKAGSESSGIVVRDGAFPVQRLRLPREKDNFDMSAGEKEAIEGAKKHISNERYWHGAFQPPSSARRSASFGLKRVVNGHLLKDYFHSGLDFAAGLGSPVKACAAGKVVLARTGFKLHGSVVAIDHGQGVISFYIHLQKILVKKDDLIDAGEKIATVGQTGRATGPHLHFSIYVNETASNPVCWFARDY